LREQSSAADGDLAHQGELIAVGVIELGQPQFGLGSAIDDVRARRE
jgi:hypothetical protein